jgi:hypothetical protein
LPPPAPTPGSIPGPISTPSDNNGAAADAAKQQQLEQQDFAKVMTDLNNNQDPISDMITYQTACLNRINDLEEENQEAMASLQANPAAWPEVSTTITTNLTTIQGILNEESTLQQLYAIKAQQNGNHWSNVATPTPTPAPMPTPTLTTTPGSTPTPTPAPTCAPSPTGSKPPGNEDFAAPPPTPTPSSSGNGSSSGSATMPGTIPPNGLNPDNTQGWGSSGSTPIPVSAVQFDSNGFNNGKDAFLNYLNQALTLMGITNPTARQNWINGYLVAGNRESSYNTESVNKTDGNAVGATQSDGAPAGSSRGIMQTIPATFAEYHVPGTSDNIYNPVANIAASMNYVMKHYGVSQDGSNLMNVEQFNPNDPAFGY